MEAQDQSLRDDMGNSRADDQLPLLDCDVASPCHAADRLL
jgi:hypothetical protein